MEETARAIAIKLRQHGHIAYFAGGCVRDMVRGLPPKDIDIATDARPEQVQKIFARTYAVGAHFGVIVVLENGLQFEIATFRSDDVYLDGRRPSEVHFSSPKEDACRRDFTINGMFFDPAKNEVIDFVDGQTDLKAKLIRAIGDPAQRFSEDRLRMLRAIRFATALEFEIEKKTWNALAQDAASITEISAERIRDELVRIFLSPHRLRGWDFDIITNTWQESLSPGNEQRSYWGSQAADQPGSANLIGIKNPAVDAMIDEVIFAKSRADLVAATKALDRVLLWNFYVVPQWTYGKVRSARWDRFGRPDPLPKYGFSGFPTVWWWDQAKAAKVGSRS